MNWEKSRETPLEVTFKITSKDPMEIMVALSEIAIVVYRDYNDKISFRIEQEFNTLTCGSTRDIVYYQMGYCKAVLDTYKIE